MYTSSSSPVKAITSRAAPNTKSSMTAKVSAQKMTETALIKKIQDKCKSRGCRGIMGIGRAFRIWDDSGNGQLDSKEAIKAFKELRVGLTEEEC